jgi:hypothetical protein
MHLPHTSPPNGPDEPVEALREREALGLTP